TLYHQLLSSHTYTLFSFHATPPTAIYTLSLHDALPIYARSSAPDHRYYAAVKDRKNSKRAALSEARKILRQACHILAELGDDARSEEHTSELQSLAYLVCRLLLEKKKIIIK